MSTETEIDLNGNLFLSRKLPSHKHTCSCQTRWNCQQFLLQPSVIERADPLGNKAYLFVFVLQIDLILAGSLPLDSLHFLSPTRGRPILQAQDLSATGEITAERHQFLAPRPKVGTHYRGLAISSEDWEEVHNLAESGL